MTEPRDLREPSLPDDLAEIASHIPIAPTGLGPLRQLLTLLPPPTGTTRVGAGLQVLDDPQQAAQQAGAYGVYGGGYGGAYVPGGGGYEPPFGSMTGNAIMQDSITAQQIKAGTITATELAAGSVTADELAVGTREGANLVPNGGFEDGWTSWEVQSAIGAGQAYLLPGWLATAKSGAQAMTMQVTTGTTDGVLLRGKGFAVSPGESYYATLWARQDGLNPRNGVILRAMFGTTPDFTDTSVYVSIGSTWLPPSGSTWYRVNTYFTVPAGYTFCRLMIGIYQPGDGNSSNTYFSVDEIAVTRSSGYLKNSDGNVVVNASGVSVTNGRITVVNPGGTVIIDGTSDIFKIAYKGLVSSASGPNASHMDLVQTISTGLTYSPTHVGFAGFQFGQLPYLNVGDGTTPLSVSDVIKLHTAVVNTNQTQVTARWQAGWNASGSGWSVTYYLFSEAAI